MHTSKNIKSVYLEEVKNEVKRLSFQKHTCEN